MIRNLIVSLIALTSPVMAANDTLPLSYIERRPFYFTEKGQAAGTLLDKVRAVAGAAKVAHEFVPMAIPRIMAEVKSKKKAHCSIGWYKTPDRVTFAQFTTAFARDEAFEILTRKDLATQIDQYPTLVALFGNKNLTLGVASGFSYGTEVDKMIHDQKPKLIDTEPEHGSLITMLGKGRFSYMLVLPGERDTLLSGAGLQASAFHTRAMSDMPPGSARHLMCSPGTPKATMESLNAAIIKLFPGF